MAQWLNPETGEMEEKPDEGPNAFSTQGATSVGPGLQGLYNQPQQNSSSFNYDATDKQYVDIPNNPLGLGGDVAAYYKAVQPNLVAHYAPGDGSFTPGSNVDINEGTAKSVLGAHGVNTSGMSLEQLKQAATSFMNNKDWWTSPQAAQMAREGIERGNSGNLWADTLQGALQVGGAALGINSLLGSGLSGLFSGAGAELGAGGLEVAGLGSDLALNPATMSSLTASMGAGGDLSSLYGASMGDVGGNSLGTSFWGGESAPNLISSTGNMEAGFGELSQYLSPDGWNQSALNPDVSSLSNTSATSLSDVIEPKQFIDDWGRGTDAAGDMVNGQGQRAWQDVVSEKLRPSMGIDGAGSLTNNMSNAWNKLTTPIGGNKMNNGGILSKLFKAPTPLEMGVRGLGALDSWNQGNKAQDMVGEQMNRMRGAEDSNAARGSFANSEWQKAQSDPMYGYDSFMQGAGRDFVSQARAAAAKSGSRGGYVNSGRMNSDLASLWQKNQSQRATSLAGGFANQPYSGSSSLTPGYASLIKNQNAPLFQGASGIMQGFKLADLFGED